MSPLQYLASVVQEIRATQTEEAAQRALTARVRQDDIFQNEVARFLLDHFTADLPCQELDDSLGKCDRQNVYVCQGLQESPLQRDRADACRGQDESQRAGDRADACHERDESPVNANRVDVTVACPKDSASHTTADGGGCAISVASQPNKDPAVKYPRLNIDKSAAIRVATHRANTRRPPRRLWPHV